MAGRVSKLYTKVTKYRFKNILSQLNLLSPCQIIWSNRFWRDWERWNPSSKPKLLNLNILRESVWAEPNADQGLQQFLDIGLIDLYWSSTEITGTYHTWHDTFEMIYFFSPQKFTFSPQPIFYPLFLNEGRRIRGNCPSKLHYRFQR